MLKRVLKNQKGLTLIELLAVLVILGIIAAIAVPAIANVISNSEKRAEVAEALNIISSAKIAQAAGVKTATTHTWLKAELDPYISTSVGSYTSVTYDASGKEFTISGHAANTHVTSGTETDLADYLDGK